MFQIGQDGEVAGQEGLFDPLFEVIGWFPSWAISAFAALVVLVLGWYLAKLVVQVAGRPVARRFERPSITRTVLQGIRVLVLAIAFVIVVRILGVEGGELLLSATVFSAVLAVILAPIVGSFISGLFVLADQPFEIGDMIELVDEETRGYVEDITLRYTKLFTLDNTFIVIPNDSIRDRDIINYSAEDERTRRSLELVVTYEGDLEAARRIAERAARNVEEVITGGPAIRVGSTRYPAAPICYIDDFGDHGVHLVLRYWVKKPYRIQSVQSQVQENVWDALEDADVEIAYPHSHVVFDETSGELGVGVRERTREPKHARRDVDNPRTSSDDDNPGTSSDDDNLGTSSDNDPTRENR